MSYYSSHLVSSFRAAQRDPHSLFLFFAAGGLGSTALENALIGAMLAACWMSGGAGAHARACRPWLIMGEWMLFRTTTSIFSKELYGNSFESCPSCDSLLEL